MSAQRSTICRSIPPIYQLLQDDLKLRQDLRQVSASNFPNDPVVDTEVFVNDLIPRAAISRQGMSELALRSDGETFLVASPITCRLRETAS